MGDIDRIVPAPPAVQPPGVARRAGDPRREAKREAREDVLELENVDEELKEPSSEPEDPEEPHTLDLAV